jgi:hypothetical protein
MVADVAFVLWAVMGVTRLATFLCRGCGDYLLLAARACCLSLPSLAVLLFVVAGAEILVPQGLPEMQPVLQKLTLQLIAGYHFRL